MAINLTILGSGKFGCNDGRANQAFLLDFSDYRILVDCGPTTMYRLQQLEIEPNSINAIMLTHFHGDHTAGLPFFMLEMVHSTADKQALPTIPLMAYGDTKQLLQELCKAYHYPFHEELWHFINLAQEPRMLQNALPKDIEASFLPMSHTPDSIGYQLRYRGKSIAITGDTSLCENVFSLAEDFDLVLLECNQIARSQQAKHTSLEEIIDKLDSFSCKQVMTVHFDNAVAEKIDAFANERLIYAEDGKRYEL